MNQRSRRPVSSSRKARSSRWPLILALGILLLFYYFFMIGDTGLIQYWQLQSHRDQVVLEIQGLESEKEKLEYEIEQLRNSPDYVEKIAREKYHMKRDDEKVFIVPEK